MRPYNIYKKFQDIISQSVNYNSSEKGIFMLQLEINSYFGYGARPIHLNIPVLLI